MIEWFQRLFRRLSDMQLQEVNSSDWIPLLVVMLASAASSLALCLLYSMFFERRATGSDVHRTFPLLGVAITAIFVCLQYSLPMSLGLLGALSIVRFRMPLKEPEEIGFLMALVATSICCATLNFVMLTLLFGLATLLLAGMRFVPMFARSRRAVASLVVTAPKEAAAQTLRVVMEVAREQLGGRAAALEGMTDVGDANTITVALFRGSADGLADLLERIRERCPDSEVGLFVNQARQLSDG